MKAIINEISQKVKKLEAQIAEGMTLDVEDFDTLSGICDAIDKIGTTSTEEKPSTE